MGGRTQGTSCLASCLAWVSFIHKVLFVAIIVFGVLSREILDKTWIDAIIHLDNNGGGKMSNQEPHHRQWSRHCQQQPRRFFEATNSNGIIDVGYNGSTLELDIRFRGLIVRRYVDVTEIVFLELKNARSTAKYFHANIRLKHASSEVDCPV